MTERSHQVGLSDGGGSARNGSNSEASWATLKPGTAAAILVAGLLFDPRIVFPDLAGLAERLLYAMVVFGLIWTTMPAYLSSATAIAWLRDRRRR